jgi:hypothetical protein
MNSLEGMNAWAPESVLFMTSKFQLSTMGYSQGILCSMSPFFPDLRDTLGPYLVDRIHLIENIVNSGLNGTVDLVLRPRRCDKSTMLQMIKLTTLICLLSLS